MHENDPETMHRKAGHTNMTTVQKMFKNGIFPEMIGDVGIIKTCDICSRGNMTRAAIPKLSKTRTQAVGDLIHSDLCGPMRTSSIQGNKYFVTYIDNFSEWTPVEFIRQKSEQPQIFKRFQTRFEKQHAVMIRILRSYGGGEYT